MYNPVNIYVVIYIYSYIYIYIYVPRLKETINTASHKLVVVDPITIYCWFYRGYSTLYHMNIKQTLNSCEVKTR